MITRRYPFVGARRLKGLLCFIAGAFVLKAHSLFALEYLDANQLAGRLETVASQFDHVAHLQRLGTTRRQHTVWMMELGSGPAEQRKKRPAMLVVAGIEGNDLVSPVSTVSWIEHLAQRYARDEPTRALLDSVTFYIFPNLNPDATDGFFANPKVEMTKNGTPFDDDHDGLVDEDGPEDLNGDGRITWMRVRAADGEYMADSIDPRILIKADPAKGERGVWKLLSEGIDNDKDDAWNEDGLGGVNLNRNFPYNYRFFDSSAGPNAVSETESRALAEFVIGHPNIGIAFTFGATDNLLQTPKSEPGGKRPPGAISDADLPFFKELGKQYRETLGLKKELTNQSEPGSFSDWMYFHRGRLSLAAIAWNPLIESERSRRPGESTEEKDSAKKTENSSVPPTTGATAPDDKGKPSPKKDDDSAKPADKRGEDERAMLKWLDQNSTNSFVPWLTFAHPDFPGQTVEIGGWAPFVRHNPPASWLVSVTQKHENFLTQLASKLPKVGFRQVETQALGHGIFNVTVQIENTGYLPTSMAQGSLTREVQRTRLLLKWPETQILAGQRVTFLGPIPGSGGMEEVRFTLRGEGRLTVEVVSALGGSVDRTVELKAKN